MAVLSRFAARSILALSTIPLAAQGTLEDYQRAERLLPMNTKRLVAHMEVRPNWIGESSRFWYVDQLLDERKRFVLVDPQSGKQIPAFDHEKLAAALSGATEDEHAADDLPFSAIEFTEDDEAIEFEIDDDRWHFDLATHALRKMKPEPPGLSPDGKLEALSRDHDLWVRNVDTGKERRLTKDGIDLYDYANRPSWYALTNINSAEPPSDPEVSVSWSEDSKRFITFRMDRRRAQKLYLLQSAPEEGFRAQVWAYERALPGDTEFATVEFAIFDVKRKKPVPVQMAPTPAFLAWGLPAWSEDGARLYITIYKRGYQQLDLFEIDATTGKARTLITEVSDTNVDPDFSSYHLVDDGEKILWTSERDGWNHIYIYNGATGSLEAQLTSGEWVVREILHVDDANGWVYFTAGGREEGRDPYYQHLYRIRLDGTELSLLTPENAEHQVHLSPDGTVFVDTYSRVDLPPRSVLRSAEDGTVLHLLSEGDVTGLLKAGWKPPEPFSVKARDGETDLFGVIYRPRDLDPATKYPIIDATYSGPQAVRTPKSYARAVRGGEQSIAQLGFVVITIDGLGTAKRSKAFHDVSWGNLGDIGAPDHIAAIKQLAERFPYIDVERVGIYGHSAGGYDASHALLIHPEFYKVGVSSAGNHDHRMAKIWWPEVYMGPFGDHYQEQSNLTLAENLDGKLLLVHGDMDNNVNPASTIRLVDELIKANKDFDLLLLPNVDHGMSDHAYFIRRRWDYFVRHLLGVDPPPGYQIAVDKEE